MSQSITLSVSGVITALNDYNGLPPGALDVGLNVESRYKNVLEPRRGFDQLLNSTPPNGASWVRLINFPIAGVERVLGLSSDGYLYYYDGSLHVVTGDYSSFFVNPNSVNAKSRFIRAGQSLFTTSKENVISLSSGTNAQTVRAGVPVGLNCEAEIDNSQSGFLGYNQVLSTTGKLTTGSPNITLLANTAGIAVGQFVGAVGTAATCIVQDLTYSAVRSAWSGQIIYSNGPLGVAWSGTDMTVTFTSGVTTATAISTAVNADATAAINGISVVVSGTGSNTQTFVGSPYSYSGGAVTDLIGATVVSITQPATVLTTTGTTTLASANLTGVVSISGVSAGILVAGPGIPADAKVVSTSGGGPYTVVIDKVATTTASSVVITFSSSLVVVTDTIASNTVSGTPIVFYAGAQVGYRMVFGRTETDINGIETPLLSAPSAIATTTNGTPWPTNVNVTGTLPKGSETELTFVQLYRSPQTPSAAVSPLAQYQLVYQRNLVAGDFSARTVTINDVLSDDLRGVALYSGDDQQGSNQTNNPPPSCWDMCAFRDFALYGNCTQPTTLSIAINSIGYPNGLQVGDTIVLTGTFNGSSFTGTYTAAASENAAAHQFLLDQTGSPSQNLQSTALSIVRVINYDEPIPVHAFYASTSTDLPGQILLQSDNPSIDVFTANCAARPNAFNPTLTNVDSQIISVPNQILVSKSGQLQAVPPLNALYAGDSSSPILRVIALRDYALVLKTDGIYKIQGTSPNSLTCTTFDLTTQIVGADTAVSLNSGVWMLSNQGVVAVSDGGVDAKSIYVDDQLTALLGNYIDNITANASAVGYDSDRKYILSIPDSSDQLYGTVQFNFNYVTECFTNWDRPIGNMFVHTVSDKLYIANANPTNLSISSERKSGTYQDFVDEAVAVTVVSQVGAVVTLTDVGSANIGDILYQSSTVFSPIIAIDLINVTVTVQYALTFTPGAASVLTAFTSTVTWKQVFGDNPTFLRQFSEGQFLFKNTRFNAATASFSTDFSQSPEDVPLTGTGIALWGLFGWGGVPWGGSTLPQKIRFYIPQNKQLGSYIKPSISITQGYSNWILQGLSISYYNASQESGK